MISTVAFWYNELYVPLVMHLCCVQLSPQARISLYNVLYIRTPYMNDLIDSYSFTRLGGIYFINKQELVGPPFTRRNTIDVSFIFNVEYVCQQNAATATASKRCAAL